MSIASWAEGQPRHGAVAAGNPDAVNAGLALLADGGNAIDAIVAAAFAMGVVEPLDCGLGGGGFATVHAGGVTECLDFIGAAPLTARYQLYQTHSPVDGYRISVRGRANELGHRSVAVPGAAAGLDALLARFGTRPLSAVLAPAIALAEDGYTIARKPALRLARTEESLRLTAETARVFLNPDGSVPTAGTPARSPDYAASLRQLAAAGAGDFYHGDLAAQIAADMAANGGFLTRHDLANYQARWRQPATGDFAGRRFATMAPPSAGQLVLAGLATLAGDDGADRLLARARAMLAMFERRSAAFGDPAFVVSAGESDETTSLAAIDTAGNAACITYSLNIHSGVVTPGTGILLNNQMLLFDPWPGSPNSVVGGKRPTSSMMPTLAFGADGVELAIGASGSTRIPTALMQVMDRVFVGGESLDQAVGGGRIHAEAERLLVDEDMAAAAAPIAASLGLTTQVMAGRDPSLGAVQGIHSTGDGRLRAVGDPRAGATGGIL